MRPQGLPPQSAHVAGWHDSRHVGTSWQPLSPETSRVELPGPSSGLLWGSLQDCVP